MGRWDSSGAGWLCKRWASTHGRIAGQATQMPFRNRQLVDSPFKHKSIINPNHTRKKFIEK